MVSRYLEVHPKDPQPRLIRQAAALIREGGIVVYPTDSCYALGCHIGDKEAMERIARIRQTDKHHHFTLVCSDFAQLGQLVKLDDSAFRAIKSATPGAYTFILPALPQVPKRLLHPRKRTVGVRIPDHPLVQALLDLLGEPLLSSTLILPGETEPRTMGWEIKEELDHVVDIVVEAGETPAEPATVVDWSEGAPEVTRVGAGDPSRFAD